MKQVKDLRFHETWIEETLPNGLTVVIFHKPQFHSSHVSLVTPFGSFDAIQQDAQGNRIVYPAGTAHFLEHKLFETDDHEDVMSEFARLGANGNAYTSYDKTACYFDTCSKDLRKPIDLLLDFVQHFSVQPESVEKEKPIILQEYHGYQADPASVLELETFRSLYVNHPIRMDICGSAESIQAMRAEDLMNAYHYNYGPSQLKLYAVTPLEPTTLLDIIQANQARKTFEPIPAVTRWIEPEPVEVLRTQFARTMDLSETRICVGIKLNLPKLQDEDYTRLDWQVRTAMDANFSSVNPAYQTWLDEKKITSAFSYESEISKEVGTLLFYERTDHVDAFVNFLSEELHAWQQVGISEPVVEQLKKRAIGSYLHMFNHPSDLARNALDGTLKGVSLIRELEIVEQLDAKRINADLAALDCSHRTVTTIGKE